MILVIRLTLLKFRGVMCTMSYYVNEYVKNTERIFPEQNRYCYNRYDMNENPQGLPKEFVEKVLKEITPEFLSIYPEPDRFLEKYANFIGVNFENVLATNGSDTAIRNILEVFGEVGKEVITVSPSFEMYRINCLLLGLKHIPVEYKEDLSIDINNILEKICKDTRIVVLLNPNNPVGNVYNDDDVIKIITKAKQYGAIVLIDEAYHYFYNQTFLRFTKDFDNVVILRTFSKLFSIAALRLGVIVANNKIIDYLKRFKLTFDVNSVALLFGERIIDEPELLDNLIKIEREGRNYILNELKNKNYECRDCKGNFIFIKPKSEAKVIAEKLKNEKHILVHPYNNGLLGKYIRVSTGSIEAMQLFLKNFLEVDNKI